MRLLIGQGIPYKVIATVAVSTKTILGRKQFLNQIIILLKMPSMNSTFRFLMENKTRYLPNVLDPYWKSVDLRLYCMSVNTLGNSLLVCTS